MIHQHDAPKLGYFKRRKLQSFYKNFVGTADLVFVFGDQSGHLCDVLTQLKVKTVAIQPIQIYVPNLSARFQGNDYFILVHEDIGACKTEFFYNGIYEREILPFSSNLSADENQEYIKITTLDDLMERFGRPSLCHIFGEGYEGEVLKGLNQAIPNIIITFYSFTKEKTAENIRRLLQLGDYEFNWKLDTDDHLKSKQWLSAKALHQSIYNHSDNPFSGEIFARLRVKFDEL